MPQGIFRFQKSYCSSALIKSYVWTPNWKRLSKFTFVHNENLIWQGFSGLAESLDSFLKSHYVWQLTCYSALNFPQNISTHSGGGTHVFLTNTEKCPSSDFTFRQYCRHRGTQEYFYLQGSNPVSSACCGDR